MSKKIELLRQSGTPVAPEAQDLFANEWALAFDEIELRAEKVYAKKTGKLTLKPKMLIIQRMSNFIERKLFLKYNVKVEVQMPQTALGWKRLSKKYQAPILIAEKLNGKGLVFIIMDTING